MNRIVREIDVILQRFEAVLPALFGRHPFPPGSLALLIVEPTSQTSAPAPNPFSIKDIIGNGIFWAVPKHRRTLEQRMQKKYGLGGTVVKVLQKQVHIQVCDTCGNHKEVGILCAFCYDKVRKETEAIKEKILKKLHLKPVETDVVVLYDGEKPEGAEEFWNGKRIIEMDKPRPNWFSKNLLQRTTQGNATTKEVKPDELG